MTSAVLKQFAVKPILSYPRSVEAGKTYLMTIDLQPLQSHKDWAYGEEEVTVFCLLNAAPLFEVEPLDPAVVIHKFGGSYGPARFLLTATTASEGIIQITLANGWGVPMDVLETPLIQSKREALPPDTIPVPRPRKPEIEWQTAECEVSIAVELQSMTVEAAALTVEQSQFSENLGRRRVLGRKVQLEMVEIPAGSFMMGAPKEEKGSSDDERPQHLVEIQSFYMGKYPVTQAQWRAVAALPQVNRSLKPNPSQFKGDDLPVEQISWHEAVEFCDRLSRSTGKAYRLPSEAEWEYACRAGTTTPFHVGEALTKELANYGGNGTTAVGSFGVANAFGLYDMHGNVWEWCADHWHENYEGAPTDGSVWVEGGDANRRVLRGGSWYGAPEDCRSAFRIRYVADSRGANVGFRVVCSLARTL